MEVALSPDLGLKCGGELVLREKTWMGATSKENLFSL